MIDWYRVVVDLLRCGLTIRAQARQAGIRHWPLYRQWRQDRKRMDLPHAEGERLLDLWVDTTRRDKDDAPKLPPCNRH